MKKKITLIILYLWISVSFCVQAQTNRFDKTYTTKFTPMTFDQLSLAPMMMRARHDQVQQRVDELIEYVLELRTETTDAQFLKEMNQAYKSLRSLDGASLAMNENIEKVRNIELGISESISNYNVRVNENNEQLIKEENQRQIEREANKAIAIVILKRSRMVRVEPAPINSGRDVLYELQSGERIEVLYRGENYTKIRSNNPINDGIGWVVNDSSI